jgi:hypothetical protein
MRTIVDGAGPPERGCYRIVPVPDRYFHRSPRARHLLQSTATYSRTEGISAMPRILRIPGAAAVIAAGAVPSAAFAATPVYSEDFSNGLGTFTASGSVTTGTYDARLSGSLFTHPSITSASIDLTGRTDVTVSYTRAASGLDAGEPFTAAYSVDGGPRVVAPDVRRREAAVAADVQGGLRRLAGPLPSNEPTPACPCGSPC